MHKLPRSFFDRDTTLVARELCGNLTGKTSGTGLLCNAMGIDRIVEQA